MVSVILGAHRLAHSGLLRQDEVIREIFGWQRGMASQSTFSRFFHKYDFEDSDRIFPALQKWWFEQFGLDKYTIDLDSTVLTRYGAQDGVEVGYNPGKKGRGSHHLVMAFVAELNMVANAWMRTGNSAAATDFEGFFDELLQVLPADQVGLVRADSGFYGNAVLSQLESHEVSYIVSAQLKSGLVNQIFHQKGWYPVQNGEDIGPDYCSFEWAAGKWEKPRRFVVIRRLKAKHPHSGGKALFAELDEYNKYTYSAFVTNMSLSAPLVWSLYRKRADCENRIKELKQG